MAIKNFEKLIKIIKPHIKEGFELDWKREELSCQALNELQKRIQKNEVRSPSFETSNGLIND